MESFDQVSLFLVVLVPLSGAILTMFVPRDRPKDAWYFAILVSGITLVLSLVLFVQYDYRQGASSSL